MTILRDRQSGRCAESAMQLGVPGGSPSGWTGVARITEARQLRDRFRQSLRGGDITAALEALRRRRELSPWDTRLAWRIVALEQLAQRYGHRLQRGRPISFPATLLDILFAEVADHPRRTNAANRAIAFLAKFPRAATEQDRLVTGLEHVARGTPAESDRYLILWEPAGADRLNPRLDHLGFTLIVVETEVSPLAVNSLLDEFGFLIELLPNSLAAQLLAIYAQFLRLRPSGVHICGKDIAVVGSLAAALAGVAHTHLLGPKQRLRGGTICRPLDKLAGAKRGGGADGSAVREPLDAIRARAREQSVLGLTESAAAHWREVLALAPADVEALVGCATCVAKLGRPGHAEQLFARAVDLDPLDAMAWRGLANAAADGGKPWEALAAWRRLALLMPKDRTAPFGCAEVLQTLGQTADAVAAICHALELQPGDIRAIRTRARMFERAGDLAAALACFEAILVRSPDDREALVRAGDIAFRLGRFEQGERLLRRALAVPDAAAKALRTMVRHLLWLGRAREAKHAIRESLLRNPRNPRVWGEVCELLRASGNERSIDRVLRRIRVSLAGSKPDRLLLADILIAAEYPERARRELGELLAEFPDDPSVCARLARLALAKGALCEAQAFEPRCFAAAATDPEERTRLAESFAAARALVQRSGRSGECLREAFLAEIERDIRGGSAHFRPRPGVVLHVAGSLALGGTERQLAATATVQQRRFGPAGEVWVLRTETAGSRRADFFLPELRANGVRLASLSRFGREIARAIREFPALADCGGAAIGLLGGYEISAFVAAFRALRPRIVHAWTPHGGAHAAIAALLLGVPRIVLRSGSVAPGSRVFKTESEAELFTWVRLLTRFALRSPRVALVNNCRSNLQDWLDWLELSPNQLRGRVGLVPNLLDRSVMRQARPAATAELLARLGVAAGCPVVGGVMRLEREKGLELWLETAQLLHRRRPDVHFILAGEGRLQDLVERLIERQGLADCVHLAGAAAQQLPELYASFAALLHTSHFEGVPNSVIEAQHYGVPVVASAVGGLPEALRPGKTGHLVPGRVAEDYARALESLIDDHQERQRMSDAARRFAARRFSEHTVLRSLDRWYGLRPSPGPFPPSIPASPL